MFDQCGVDVSVHVDAEAAVLRNVALAHDGAGPLQTFLRVTLPIAAPGIAAGALLAFALSFDDFIITNFNAGSTVTFTMFVWGSAQRGTPVQINVIGTAMFVIAVAVVLLGQLIANRRKSRAGK